GGGGRGGGGAGGVGKKRLPPPLPGGGGQGGGCCRARAGSGHPPPPSSPRRRGGRRLLRCSIPRALHKASEKGACTRGAVARTGRERDIPSVCRALRPRGDRNAEARRAFITRPPLDLRPRRQ